MTNILFGRDAGDLESNSVSRPLSLSDMASETALGLSSSFRYDPTGFGIKSTQQLNVDWSDFASHTFFHSAQVKTNQSFQKIYDRFPFDGTKEEVETFVDSLTGFEKYVYNQIPKHVGYLFFSGTNTSESSGGTYVSTIDSAGGAYNTLTRNPTGLSILNPGLNSFTCEFHLFVPGQANSNQIVMQKQSGTHGITTYLDSTASPTLASIKFEVCSGSSALLAGPMLVTKNEFNHIAFVWDRSSYSECIYGYLNGVLECSSSKANIGLLDIDSATFYIGSGSATSSGFTPQTTLSGAVDEFRVWHTARNSEELSNSMYKSVFSPTGLKLHYKFNEPPTDRTIVVDSSGMGMFGDISTTGMILGARNSQNETICGTQPVLHEQEEYNPILFPEYNDSVVLRNELLVSASNYDADNPSLITKLVPPHYFRAGQEAMGFEDAQEGPILDTLIYSTSAPGRASVGETQAILLVLFTMAKFFDELKLFTANIGNLLHVEYPYDNFDVAPNTTPDQFLQFLGKHYGIELPPLFVGSTIPQFINGENLTNSSGFSEHGLQFIQNQIWRRILLNIKDVINSKGTINSIKSFIRSVGIEPDNIFRIRESGTSGTKTLHNSFEKRSEVMSLVDFSNNGLLQSNYLTSSRIEPGWPDPSGNTTNDSLLTSGSFTLEGFYKLPFDSPANQSLMRFCSTGSNGVNLLANMVAVSGSGLNLYVNTYGNNVVSMSVTDFNPCDNQLWHFSFGRRRNDEFQSDVSSSWFLRASRANNGKIVEQYSSSLFVDDRNSIVQQVTVDNASGSFIMIGSSSIPTTSSFLNDSALPSICRTTTLNGEAGFFKFWSRGLNETEWLTHTKNPKSIGTTNPTVSFGFLTTESGSFQKLRMDVTSDQNVTESNGSGQITLIDFSQNGFEMQGSGFAANSRIIVPERMFFSYPSPYFDELTTSNKVRIKGLLNPTTNEFENEGIEVSPIYNYDETQENDGISKLAIDIDVTQALNQDIMQIFAGMDELDNILGRPNSVFGDGYKEFVSLRDDYFKRLVGVINLKVFFDFYKWFDTNLGRFIANLIPSTTSYDGIEYLVSPNILERSRTEYKYATTYLGQSNRQRNSTLTLQFFTGKIKRF